MRTFKVLGLLLLLMAAVMMPAKPVEANSAEPPRLIIITANPPEDLVLSLLLEGQQVPIRLQKEQQAWEARFQFYYHQAGEQVRVSDEMILLVESDRLRFRLPLPDAVFSGYSNLLTLDLDAQTLTLGQPAFRVPLLVGLRVALTLMVEGVIFFWFGYRRKASWALFFLVNIITQTGLNALITGPIVLSAVIYYLFLLVFGEMIILLVETGVFSAFLKESSRRRAALYALTANLASLVLGGWLISSLPI